MVFMENRSKVIVRTSIIGILGNIGLVVLKAIVGIFAHSIAIIMDAINNLSDALSSTITIIGTKLSQKKPDAKHPYGHGRVEYITSLAIGVIIIVAGVGAIVESIKSIIEGGKPTFDVVALVLIAVAVVVKIVLGLYFRHVGKKVNSEALKGSGMDALFDALLSFGTLVSIAVTLIWKDVRIEGYVGTVIGLFMIKSGIDVLKSSLSSIIGERTSKETSEAIKHLVCQNPEVKGAYDLIVNNYGPDRGIGSIHIEVSDDMTNYFSKPFADNYNIAAASDNVDESCAKNFLAAIKNPDKIHHGKTLPDTCQISDLLLWDKVWTILKTLKDLAVPLKEYMVLKTASIIKAMYEVFDQQDRPDIDSDRLLHLAAQLVCGRNGKENI